MPETNESNTSETDADAGKSDLLSDLLDCPFCGSSCVNDTTKPQPDAHGVYMWVCPDCVACGPIGATVEEATYRWNKRAN